MLNGVIKKINSDPNMSADIYVKNIIKYRAQYEGCLGEKMVVNQCDLYSDDIVEQLCASTKKYSGLIYAAGVSDLTLVRHMTRKKLLDVYEINFIKPLLIAKTLIARSSLTVGANIIFLSSVSGIDNVAPGISSYSTSKAALNNLVKVLALENIKNKIKFNTVCPGIVRTDFVKSIVDLTGQRDEPLLSRYPHGFGMPDDISPIIWHLLTENTWINGQNITIDGGFSIT